MVQLVALDVTEDYSEFFILWLLFCLILILCSLSWHCKEGVSTEWVRDSAEWVPGSASTSTSSRSACNIRGDHAATNVVSADFGAHTIISTHSGAIRIDS